MSDDSILHPPQYAYDLLAEQALLRIALHGDELALQLTARLVGSFWDARHKLLAATLAGMHGSGQSVDLVSVMGQVIARGHVTKITGPWLHTVQTGPGDHSGVVWYADRIRELAGRRRLIEVTGRAMQRMEWGWTRGEDVEVRSAIAEFRSACDEVEESSRPDGLPGPQSMAEFLDGPMEFDWIIPGLLERNERIIITGGEGHGKATSVDHPIPTRAGWSTMGTLQVGDEVFAPDGSITRVIAATEVLEGRPCYRVTFSDGAQVVADSNHLWLTETLMARESAAKDARRGPMKLRGRDQRYKRKHFPSVVTTEYIAETLTARNGHAVNHSVECSAPLDPPHAVLPIDPYLLGVWLGDGHTSGGMLTLNRHDAPVIESRIGMSHRVPSAESPGCVGVRINGFAKTLRDEGLLGFKHIPQSYMRASATQRWELLAGLMDTDGYIEDSRGYGRGYGAASCELTLCDKQLASDALELLWSLGIKVTIRESDAILNGRITGRRWRMTFQCLKNPFRVPRKAHRWEPMRTRRAALRYITSVQPVESVPVRCIQVDRPDGMFLIGRECIPTHNSVLCRQLAACMAGSVHAFSASVLGRGDRGIRVLAVDCENSAVQSRRGYKRMVGHVDTIRNRAGMGSADWKTQMFIDIRPEGLDLLGSRDVGWLEHAIASSAPDLLVIGPLYKLFNADPSNEQAIREVTVILDGLRIRHGFALLMEAHAGKGVDVDGDRRMEPIGSSLWKRWPENGFGIRRAKDAKQRRPEIMDVVSWRGSREERQWPEQLRHGVMLPWEPVHPMAEHEGMHW